MHPAGPPPPPPQNRSCPSPALAPCPSPSPSLIQQQQQHVIYGPITTLQPCAATLHPHCIYTGVQRNPGLSATTVPLTHQGTKWQPKSKPPRGHHQQHPHHHHHHYQPHHQPQYRQPITQQQVQQSLSYIPKPLVLFDQCPTNQSIPGAPPAGTSFLVTSSTFTNGHYGPGEPYSSASGLTLIPQPYFKPPDVAQAFCLLPERPRPPHQQQQSLPVQNQPSYYNISAANGCNLQTITSKPGFQLTNATNSYGNLTAFGANHINAGQTVAPNQIFQNPPMTFNHGPTPRDKLSMVANIDVQTVACSGNQAIPGPTKQQHQLQQLSTPRPENVDWAIQAARENADNMFEVPDCGRNPKVSSAPILADQTDLSTISKSLTEERYSDETATSFDFTIEAEKMVSELCNTASANDFGKDENHERNDNSTSFGGAAGDNVTNKTNIWFADFCTEYGVSLGPNYRNTSTQTQENKDDGQQCPESMRKTIYWGCNEAESILNSDNYRCGSRAGWLGNISSATKIAVTKSSTCFPIFSSDRTFVEDLINAHLRISNGWLVLDNYLNKQHYPNLNGKFDGDLMQRFKNWESSTNELLKEVVTTFVKIEKNNSFNNSPGLGAAGRQENQSNNSFPGDVCHYTDYDLFDGSQGYQDNSVRANTDEKSDRDSTYTLQYASQTTNHPNVRSFEAQRPSPKETKLRSKWTITENLTSTIDSVKSITDVSQSHHDPGISGSNRFRVKNVASPSNKITSARHSLNAEFFHLRNKVMESMENCSESERQRWGLKEHHYDFVFGSSRGSNAAAIVPSKIEPVFKIRTGGTNYENTWTQRCPSRMDSTVGTNQTTMSQCANVDGRVYVVSGLETALNSTYITAGPPAIRNKTYVEPDYTATIAAGPADYTGNNCRNDSIVSSASLVNVTTDPVYAGKSRAGQRELAAVPRPKMTLLSQIEGNTTSDNSGTKEMTANLSAWFASIRNATGHRVISCPVDDRKNDKPSIARTSSHPQETSRSAMDLNRQLHMDGNRQLQTLQNMQTIQSQPWNACNLLNNKRGSCKIPHLDEYDSSEDVRVYMKPGSYNVPKKRHHRKNLRRNDVNLASSRMNNHTPRGHNNRTGSLITHNSSIAKNHQISTSVSALVISSTVHVSSTTTNTTTSVKIPFPATPIVQPPANFSMEDSPGMLRRVRSISNRDARQDVAWKAACASAEILLEALNVKKSSEAEKNDEISQSSIDNARTLGEQRDESDVQCSVTKETDKSVGEFDVYDPSSYETSEDDSDSTCKLSQNNEVRQKSRDTKQPRTNVKTDFWLIRTLNNASIVSKISNEESDGEGAIDQSLNDSIKDNRRDVQTVVTSTPEPVKNPTNENSSDSTVVTKNLDDSFQEQPTSESPRGCESEDVSTSGSRQAPSNSNVDTSRDSVSRATYSETVRRSTGKCCATGKKDFGRSRTTRSASFGASAVRSSMLSASGKKSQRRDNDKVSQVSRKSGKRLASNLEDKDGEDGFANKRIVKEDAVDGNSARVGVTNSQTRKKEEMGLRSLESKGKPTDRGWSVWYSSRRRQTLSPLALNKLSTIHQTVWQMEGAQVLKYPSASSNTVGALSTSIEDYCKIIKSPMFLETIGYKLKNRIYHKVEHVIRDFRRIINNSKLYHKNDNDRIAEVDTLSRKLDELFEKHFENRDLDNALDSPRDDNTSVAVQSSRYKSPQKHHKSAANRVTATAKKSSTSSSKNEH